MIVAVVVVLVIVGAMVVTMTMPVVVTVVVAVMMVAVIVAAMAVIGDNIRSAFRIERCLDLDHAGAEALDHVFDHVIATNAQVLSGDLHRQVPIAEMPGDTHQMPGIHAANFDQRLRRRDHLDEPAIVQHQRITAAQRHGLRQIEQKIETARCRHCESAPVPVVELQHHAIGRSFAPGAGCLDRCRS